MPKEFLSDNEKAAIIMFNESDVMKEAVRKVLLEALYSGSLEKGQKADPLQNIALVFVSQNLDKPDTEIGANLRALYHGINYLEIGFNNLAKYKRPKEANPISNPAI